MSARTNIQSMTGALLAISAERPATFDVAGYSDTGIDWTTIGTVETFGNHGMTAQEINFTAIEDAVVQKLKGSKNYGTMSLTLGHIPIDDGQVLVATASESQNRYSVRLTYPVGDGEATPEIHYIDGLIMSREFQDGGANDVRKLAVSIAVCRKQVEKAAT